MIFSSKKVKKKKYNLHTIHVNEINSNLSEDDLTLIFSFLDVDNYLKFYNVNKRWHKIIREKEIWKSYFDKSEYIKVNNLYSLPSDDLNYFQKCLRRNNCIERVKESLVEFINHSLFKEEFYLNSIFQNLFEGMSDSNKIEFQKSLIYESNQFGSISKVEEIWNENEMIYTGYICGIFVEIKVERAGMCSLNFYNEIGNENWKNEDSIDDLTSFVSNNFKL
eukprot:gene2447-3157_t